MLQELKQATQEACTVQLPEKTIKTPRMTVIHELIQAQSKPQTGIHFLKLEKAYLRCTQCRAYILARTNEQAFERFVGETCWYGPLPPGMWRGHSSHTMVRKGHLAECAKCGAKGRIQEETVVVTSKLKNACESQTPDLRPWFT